MSFQFWVVGGNDNIDCKCRIEEEDEELVVDGFECSFDINLWVFGFGGDYRDVFGIDDGEIGVLKSSEEIFEVYFWCGIDESIR